MMVPEDWWEVRSDFVLDKRFCFEGSQLGFSLVASARDHCVPSGSACKIWSRSNSSVDPSAGSESWVKVGSVSLKPKKKRERREVVDWVLFRFWLLCRWAGGGARDAIQSPEERE